MSLSALIIAHRVEVVAFAACSGLMLLIFELVRSKRIKEKYSLLWFATGVTLLILVFKKNWLFVLSEAMGVYSPPIAFFLVLWFFVIVILIHFSTVVSELRTQNQKLAQKVALLEAEVAHRGGGGGGDDEAA